MVRANVQQAPQGGSFLTFLAAFVFLLAVFAGVTWFTLPRAPAVASAGIVVKPADEATMIANYIAEDVQVTNGVHSIAKHLSDARAIHKCLDKPGGVFELWRFVSHRRQTEFFQICRMHDERYGLRLVEKRSDGNWYERTSFVVKNGTYEELCEYVTAKAARYFGKLSTFTG